MATRCRTLRKTNQRQQRRALSNHKDPKAVEEVTEGVANEKVQENIAEIAKDPTSLQTLAEILTTPQKETISKLISELKSRPTIVPPATRRDLYLVALNTSIPFVGFGIMDNAILILAGDAIDIYLGVWLGITTMCAAAIGNIVSDVAGVLLGTVVEDFCALHLRLPVPKLTTAQRQLRTVRFANQAGCALGLVVGCIIGMFPLLFLDADRTHAIKKKVALNNLFEVVVSEAGDLVGAERTRLYIRCRKPASARDEAMGVEDEKTTISINQSSLWDWLPFGTKQPTNDNHDAIGLPTAEGDYLHAKYTKSQAQAMAPKNSMDDERWVPLGRGLVSRAALTGEVWNIENVTTEPDFIPESYDSDPRNMLCVPVLDGNGDTIGVLQATNKLQTGYDGEKKDSRTGFTENDIQTLQALASHVSVSLQRMYYEGAGAEEEEHEMKQTIQILKSSALIERHSDTISSRNIANARLVGTSVGSARRSLFPED